MQFLCLFRRKNNHVTEVQQVLKVSQFGSNSQGGATQLEAQAGKVGHKSPCMGQQALQQSQLPLQGGRPQRLTLGCQVGFQPLQARPVLWPHSQGLRAPLPRARRPCSQPSVGLQG